MDVKDFTKEHQKDVVEEARRCALATIHHIYEHYEDENHGLCDVEMDKVRDALQTLMCIKSVE